MMTDKTEAMDNLIAQDADLIDPQPKQSEVLKIARERITEWCDAVAVEWGQGSQTHNVARDGRDIGLAALRQPQTDALAHQLLQECLVKLRDVQGTQAPKQYACNLIKRIERVLQEQSK
jgi:hypothetical protein